MIHNLCALSLCAGAIYLAYEAITAEGPPEPQPSGPCPGAAGLSLFARVRAFFWDWDGWFPVCILALCIFAACLAGATR